MHHNINKNNETYTSLTSQNKPELLYYCQCQMPRTFSSSSSGALWRDSSSHRSLRSFDRRCRMSRAFLGVSPIVSNQVEGAGEGPRAYSALEGLLSSVHLQMATEIAVAKEPSGTAIDGTGVRSVAH
ncbi:hypothetical protein CEXT_265081 [Caerostris extrusa]|uniref:Uncharacterized protein n=1 Tax=Caerostris extrusa TaxID=172846 RepID=A0AAV4NAD3_CAEEX|nr:hypothetical protein CEXT_265081 [Caerostris extrusa]